MDVYKINAAKLWGGYDLQPELSPLRTRAARLMDIVRAQLRPPSPFLDLCPGYVRGMHGVKTALFGTLIARDDFDQRSYRVLDLGCGASQNQDEALSPSANSGCYEPWLARSLPLLGHSVIGIEVQAGILGEEFPHINGDFLESETYGSIPAGTIDLVTANYVFCSPSLKQQCPGVSFEALYARVLPQVRRVLRPDGAFVINNGVHDGPGFQLLEGTHWLAGRPLILH